MNSLSEQALSVYCDEVVRDVVEKNNKLRDQNASLEPLRSLLLSLKLNVRGVASKEMNLFDYENEEEDAEYLSYSIGDFPEFPLEEIYRISFDVSGVSMDPTYVGIDVNATQLAVIPGSDPPSAELFLQSTKDVRVTGILSSFPVSLAEVQNMTKHSNYKMYIENLGFITNDPVTEYEAFLEGTTYRFTKLEIRKSVLQPALSCSEAVIHGTALEELEELQTLAQANSNHVRLCQAAEEHKNLVHHNAILKECRKLVQSFEVEYSGGSIHFNLESGHCKTYQLHEVPVWYLEPRAEENTTLSISDISFPTFRISNIPFNVDYFWSRLDPILFEGGEGAILKFGHYDPSSVSTVFLFDETLDRVDVGVRNINFYHYIYNALMTPADSAPNLGLTMRFMFLLVPMMGQRLRLLGIDIDASD